MNKKRSRVEEFVKEISTSSNIQLYLGNKIIKCLRNDEEYYDISLIKEVFIVDRDYQGDEKIYSISDFSNFQKLHRNNTSINKTDSDDVFAPYTNLKLFTAMEPNKYYVTHLRPLWKYIRLDNSSKDIAKFVYRYNEKNLPRIVKRIHEDQLQITDWWYCGGEVMSEEDYVEIVSTTPDNLSAALSVVYDGGYSKERCLRKTIRK